MKVLLNGATGFVGRSVARQLHRAGHRLRIITRHPGSESARVLNQDLQAEVVSADVLNWSSLASALHDMEAVIHLVGIISEVGDQTFERVHTEGTRHVIEAARQSGVRRYVHMSALGSRSDAVSRYHQSKWQAEELVRASGLDWTIFRPSIIYGPRDGFVNLFARVARIFPFVPVMGSGQSRIQPVHVETVAHCFVRALELRESIGRNFDLCGPDRFTLDELLDEICAAMKVRRVKLHLPLPLAHLLAGSLEVVYPRLRGKAPPLNRDQLIMLQEDNTGDREPSLKLFHPPERHFGEAIRDYL